MDVLPAIDIRGGKVVRLSQGDYGQETAYGDDPSAAAKEFARLGARWLHVVDLDAARSGSPANTEVVRAVRRAVGTRIELGGGARTQAAIDGMLGLGVDRVVVGSAALGNWKWFEALIHRADLAGRIALGLDARDGRLAVHGWTERIEATAAEVASRVRGWPLAAIVYTDIARDGMLAGVNVPATEKLIHTTDVPVIASGGVASIDDVRRCKAIGCLGVIIGRAYYEGRIDLAEALRVAQRREP